MKKLGQGFNRLLTVQGRILYKLSLVALALALVGFLYQEYVLHAWAQTDATISGASASYALDSAATTCTADYRLKYKVGETEYVAVDRNRAGADCTAWGNQMDARVGTTQPILYNPLDPSAIYLRAGYNTEFFFLPLLLVSLAGGLGILGFFCIRLAEWNDMEETTRIDLSAKSPERVRRAGSPLRRRA